MPILNRNNYPYLVTWGDVNRTQDVQKHIANLNVPIYDETRDSWLLGIFHGDAFYHFPINTLIPQDVLEKIRRNEIDLLLWNHHEPYHHIVDGIYKFVVMGSEIPPESIVLISSSADIDKEIKVVSQKYNLGKIKAVYSREFEYIAKTVVLSYFKDPLPKTLIDKPYPKRFLSFNGLWRPHRAAFVSFLSIFNLLENGHLSYNAVQTDKTPADSYQSVLELFKEHTMEYNLIFNNKEHLLNLNPIHLDTTYDNHFHKAQYQDVQHHLYEETYFSVVTETVCLENDGARGLSGVGRLLSEKTWKPIIFKHPFIIMGVQGVLKLMKELGYKTFSPYIDESYDDEPHGPTRVFKIVKEVERLCNLNENQRSEFLQFCRDIVEFNYNHLLEQETFYKRLN